MTYYAVTDEFISQFDGVRKAQFALAAGLGIVAGGLISVAIKLSDDTKDTELLLESNSKLWDEIENLRKHAGLSYVDHSEE